jgi:hypothetical protein
MPRTLLVILTSIFLCVIALEYARVGDETGSSAAGRSESLASASISIGDWSLSYVISSNDGLHIYDADYQDQRIFTSLKLVEWHADYGGFGFVYSTGETSGGGGFTIYPYGDIQLLDLFNTNHEVEGFEIVQDFRMLNWGNDCNERFDQRIQFFHDGRFRVVSGAYGKGCDTEGVYRPVVRLDMAVAGDAGDSFFRWDGSNWVKQSSEGWWQQSTTAAPGGYDWRVNDASATAYFITPGMGQFSDGGRGDSAYIYGTRHRVAEGDVALATIGSCCNDDHQQGPEQFINNESIDTTNLVFWYVPQMVIDASSDDGDAPYCWTIQGEPNPETYPCFSGPMFVPARRIALPFMGN